MSYDKMNENFHFLNKSSCNVVSVTYEVYFVQTLCGRFCPSLMWYDKMNEKCHFLNKSECTVSITYVVHLVQITCGAFCPSLMWYDKMNEKCRFLNKSECILYQNSSSEKNWDSNSSLSSDSIIFGWQEL